MRSVNFLHRGGGGLAQVALKAGLTTVEAIPVQEDNVVLYKITK